MKQTKLSSECSEVVVNVEDLGCWTDTKNRAIQPIENIHPLLKDRYQSRNDAYDKCLKATLSFGYKVFALQDGGWCASASDAEDTYDKYGRSYGCGADGEGGDWANQVYNIKDIGKLPNQF